ncbi:hypothetical protein [Aurantivibrio plasticivorans]
MNSTPLKSESLVLRNPKIIGNSSDPTEKYDLVYSIPYLAAYDVVGHQLRIARPRNHKVAIPQEQFELTSRSLRVQNQTIGYRQALPTAHLTIQFTQIKNYRDLFSYIEDNERIKRLAALAEEADKCFDSEAWTAYCVMATGVIEGILGSFYGGKKTRYATLLKTAYQSKIISAQDYYILDKLCESEALIHVSNHDIPMTTKRTASAVNRVYWRVIRTDWNSEV